jgi:CHAD domain-containing protein
VNTRTVAQAVSAKQLSSIQAELKMAMTSAKAWRPDAEGWDSIGQGLHSTYRRGRRALRRARKDRAIDDLHEWRKQTKYLWHQLQMFAPIAAGPIGELADEFHHLADYLGDEHDLAVLRPRVPAAATELVDRRREELQDKAFALGERLYADKSNMFVQRLEEHWTQWRREGR